MRWNMICAIVFALAIAASTLRADEDEKEEPKTPADQYLALLEEYQEVRQPREFAGKFLELAESHPQDPVAVDSLVWVISSIRRGDEPARAVDLLLANHIDNERLAEVCQKVMRVPSLHAEKLLREVLDKSPHQNVQAQACFLLANYLKNELMIVEQIEGQPELVQRIAQSYGEDFSKHLASLDEKTLGREREQLYERMVKSFADVEAFGGTLGDVAERGLFEIRHLSVGRVAPEIEGDDIDGDPFKLSDYRGNVVVLDFWGHW